MSAYVFDNAAAPAGQRFAGLQASYDQVTIRQLEQIGVSAGWSCLEVGGGGGSIARWLARQVTPGGHVVVTDIDPRWLESGYPDIELRRHDIVVDELEEDSFDLAHERLVLIHLPERDRALRRMIDSLRPGGWLLIEDFDCTWLPLGPYGEPAQAALFTRVVGSLNRVLERRSRHGLRPPLSFAAAEAWPGRCACRGAHRGHGRRITGCRHNARQHRAARRPHD